MTAALVSPEAPTVRGKGPGSTSFPVETDLNHKLHVVNLMFLMLLGGDVVFLHTTKNNFVRFVLRPRRLFEVFDKLPHFDNGSCVCTLFLLTFYYYFCEILHLLLLYR